MPFDDFENSDIGFNQAAGEDDEAWQKLFGEDTSLVTDDDSDPPLISEETAINFCCMGIPDGQIFHPRFDEFISVSTTALSKQFSAIAT